jgi:hypothetical protein
MHGAVVRDRQTGELQLHAESGVEERLRGEIVADLAAAGSGPHEAPPAIVVDGV